MPDSAALKLQAFSNRIRLGKLMLKCAVCNDFRSCSGEMQRHLYDTHGGPDKHFCPWCTSKVVRWLPNEKRFHVEHLRKCFDKYEKLYCTQDIRTVYRSGELQKQFWNVKVEKCNVPIPCVRCKNSEIYPRHMEKHYREFHNVDVKSQCVWCDGYYHGKDACHLNPCFDKRLRDAKELQKNVVEPLEPMEENYAKLLNLNPMCSARHLYGRKKLPNLNKTAYTHIFLPQQNLKNNNALKFRKNIELASSYLSLFLREKNLLWYHIIVKASVFNKFYRLLENTDRSSFFLTHFWTWCDGGDSENDYHNHHRHMIFVTKDPKFIFSHWRKLKDPTLKKSKTSIPIKTPQHLINTLSYVSRKRSECNFFTDLSKRNTHHFYIGTSLPKSFKKCLYTQMEGFDYYIMEKFGQKSVKPFVNLVTRGEDGKYQLQLKYLPEDDEVLPVETHWRPNKHLEEGEAYMNLLNGKKLFFEKDESLQNLTREEWIKVQMEGGNWILGSMKEEYWTLSVAQQKKLNLLMPYVEKARDLEIRVNNLEAKIENLQTENKRLRESEIQGDG